MARAKASRVKARSPHVCSVGDEPIAVGETYVVGESFRRRTAFCLKHEPTPAQVAQMAPKSRADRAGDVASELDSAADELESLAEDVRSELESADETDDEGNEKPLELDEGTLAGWRTLVEAVGWDWSEVESLAEEMRSWADNMESANEGLANSSKHDEVSECADTLEGLSEPDGAPSFPGSATRDDLAAFADECEERAGELRDVSGELGGVHFPTAF